MDTTTATRTTAPDVRWIAIVGAASLLLVDAAIETWWSGSPVRGWLAGGVVAYAAAAALARRRVAWPTAAALSSSVLLGAIAATAWLPGGLTSGARIAGQSTSTVLTLVVMVSVVFAAVVVWRHPILPRAFRTAVLLLAAYASAAFVLALAAHVPFVDLFSGGSLWQRLPSWLQGAFVGGVVVLPLALLTAVVRAGIPRFRDGSVRHAIYQVVALATSLAIVVAAMPAGGLRPARAVTVTPEAARAAAPIVPSPALSETLEHSLRAMADGERESPRDHWDPAYVVEQVGRDPQALYDWVASETFWIPYKGVLRDAPGVLMDRMGNSLDRALLLAALLKEAGHAVRLAHGELTVEQAGMLLPSLITARPGGERSGPRPALAQIAPEEITHVAAQYRLDGTAIAKSLGSRAADGTQILSQLENRVAEQNTRLRAAVGDPPPGGDRSARLDAAVDALRDHWWVQGQADGVWVDWDLVLPNRQAITIARETLPVDGLGAALFHEVVVRVISEQWSDGRVAEHVALQHRLRPSELVGKPVALRLWPRRWPSKTIPGPNPRQYIRTVALSQHEWLASLQIGRDTAAEVSLLDTGEINEHPAVSDFAKIGGSGAGAVDDVTSMLRGVTPEQTQVAEKKTAMTALWFEYEIRVPGEPSRTSRRTVFDLLGPAARARRPVPQAISDEASVLVRSLSQMMETEILAVGYRVSPEFYRHLVADSLLRNQEILRSLARGEISETTDREELAGKLAPIPGPLYPLSIARFERSRVGDAVFVASPNVLSRHIYPASLGGARIALRDATDIVANEVGVDLRVKDAFATRFEQGVFDTNAETFLQAEPKVAANTANAFAASTEWVTLTPASHAQLETLRFSDDDRRRIALDLDAGATVVAPRRPVRLAGEDFVGWWRIDPARGDVLGVDGRGWGQASAGYVLLLSTVIGFELSWLMCEVPPEGMPGTTTARAWVPVLDQLIVPLEASGGECLVAGLVGAAMAAAFGLMGAIGESGPVGKGGGGGRGGGGNGGGGNRGGGNGGNGGGGNGGGGGSGGGGGGGGRYSGPGGANPAEEVNPMGKTQPGTASNGSKTQPGGPPSEMEPGPVRPAPAPRPAGPVTPEELANAEQELQAAQRESAQATKDYVNYRAMKPNPGRNNPGDPSYDPVEDAIREDTMFDKTARANDALYKLKEIQDAAAAQRAAARPVGKGGGFPPPRPAAEPSRGLPGCPPNCRNNDGADLQDMQAPGGIKSLVGAAGVSKVLGGQ
jgi:hypothetical protein